MVNSVFNGWRMEDVWLDNETPQRPERPMKPLSLASRPI